MERKRQFSQENARSKSVGMNDDCHSRFLPGRKLAELHVQRHGCKRMLTRAGSGSGGGGGGSWQV